MPTSRGRRSQEPSAPPGRSILKLPQSEAQAKLASRIRAGLEFASTQIPSLETGPAGPAFPSLSRSDGRQNSEVETLRHRADQWRDYNRTWLDTNLGGEAAEEYRSASTHWHFGGTDDPHAELRFLRQEIESEVSKLQSIHDRLDLWLPQSETTSAIKTSQPSPAGAISHALDGEPATSVPASTGGAAAPTADRSVVMAIYGHDHEANTALLDWLRAIGLRPMEFNQLIQATGTASPYIGDAVRNAFNIAQAVIAFFTPDERVIARTARPEDPSAWRLQARPNVLIEAGMALITHPDRTVLAVLGTQELPSDLAGRHFVHLSRTSSAPLHDLAGRLHQAGCLTDTTGTAWLDPARFPDRSHITPAPPTWHGASQATRPSADLAARRP